MILASIICSYISERWPKISCFSACSFIFPERFMYVVSSAAPVTASYTCLVSSALHWFRPEQVLPCLLASYSKHNSGQGHCYLSSWRLFFFLDCHHCTHLHSFQSHLRCNGQTFAVGFTMYRTIWNKFAFVIMCKWNKASFVSNC